MSTDTWRDYAACRDLPDADVNLFFPDERVNVPEDDDRYETLLFLYEQEAKKVCLRCQVKRDCLLFALSATTDETDDGIYGGTTPKERRSLRRRHRAKLSDPS